MSKVTRHFGTDFWSGLLIAAFGALGVWEALGYRLGTAISMGPGYFPLLVYSMLAVLGLVVAGRGLLSVQAPFGSLSWRPLLTITGALLAFWLLCETAGFAIASIVLMLVAIRAQNHLRWSAALLFTLPVVLLATLVFVYALGLPFPVWPQVF